MESHGNCESKCIEDGNGRIYFDETKRGRTLKEYMEGFINQKDELGGVLDAE